MKAIPRAEILYEQCNKGVFVTFAFADAEPVTAPELQEIKKLRGRAGEPGDAQLFLLCMIFAENFAGRSAVSYSWIPGMVGSASMDGCSSSSVGILSLMRPSL